MPLKTMKIIAVLWGLAGLLTTGVFAADERYVLHYDAPAREEFLPPKASMTGGHLGIGYM